MNELVSASQEDEQVEAPARSSRFRGGLRGALRFVLDVALPPLCPSCREPLGDGVGLCAPCWSKLSFIEKPYCARLGIPFVYDPGPGLLSMDAIADPPAYDRARAAVRYDDVLTSGATVDTCARALLRAGTAHVDVLVFARVVAALRTTI
jgi:predicted amidophosphoribosyltransferase